MLLRNESRVKHSIDIKLVFDDGTVKELEIHEGNHIQISYRRNGCLKCGVGVIRRIKPYISKLCERRESAVIVLDMSEDNRAHVEKIDLEDIVDIKLICPCCGCECSNQEVTKPETPEVQYPCGNTTCKCKEPKVQYSCLVGTAVTNKGVVAHE